MNEGTTRSLAVRLAWLALLALFAQESACPGPGDDQPLPKNNIGLACTADTDCAPPSSVCCDKRCTDATGQSNGVDPPTCGTCGTTCPGSQSCCQTGGEWSCTTASTDVFNCGGCGIICAANEECVHGVCQPPGDDGGGDSGACSKLGSWQECTMNVPSNPGGGCCSGLTCGFGYPTGASSPALSVCCVKWGADGCQQNPDCCAVNANVLPTCNSGKCCVASGAACDSLSDGAPCCSGVCMLNASNLYACQ